MDIHLEGIGVQANKYRYKAPYLHVEAAIFCQKK